MPVWMILTVHFKQGHLMAGQQHDNLGLEDTYVLQYKTASFPTLSLPASRRAFSSACRQTHSVVLPCVPLQWSQPPSLQFFSPRAVPLYPEARTLFSRTIIAPTRRFMQFDRREASEANVWSKGLTAASHKRIRTTYHEVCVPSGP